MAFSCMQMLLYPAPQEININTVSHCMALFQGIIIACWNIKVDKIAGEA